jgi:hypothetical protein
VAAESGILIHLFQGANLMAANDEKVKQIEQIMGDPMAIEPTEYEERIRRNLLIISCLSIMVWWFGATPSGHLEIWGLSFEHLDIRALSIVALSITGYQLVHYGWVVWNKLAYWRVRLTGVRLQVVRGALSQGFSGSGIDPVDYIGDERSSNLYRWVIEGASNYHALVNSLAKQHEIVNSLEHALSNSQISSEQQIKEALVSFDNTSKKLIEELKNVRINVSLRRFDSWFHMMVLSQSIRWFVLDLFIPLSLGVIAISGLSFMIYGSSDYSVSQACLPLFDNSLI